MHWQGIGITSPLQAKNMVYMSMRKENLLYREPLLCNECFELLLLAMSAATWVYQKGIALI